MHSSVRHYLVSIVDGRCRLARVAVLHGRDSQVSCLSVARTAEQITLQGAIVYRLPLACNRARS